VDRKRSTKSANKYRRENMKQEFGRYSNTELAATGVMRASGCHVEIPALNAREDVAERIKMRRNKYHMIASPKMRRKVSV
jgi:hypothetical protein